MSQDLGMVVHISNPNSQGPEAGLPGFGQCNIHRTSLSPQDENKRKERTKLKICEDIIEFLR